MEYAFSSVLQRLIMDRLGAPFITRQAGVSRILI